jgi:fructokinase
VAGEAIVDLVATEGGTYHPHPGGSPANVAVGLARLGIPVRMGARISEDRFGTLLRAHLEGNGVDCRTTVLAGQPSSLALVSTGADGQPSYDLRLEGTCDWQWNRAEAMALHTPDLAALHLGSLATVIAPGAAILLELADGARADTTISYDPNIRPAITESIPDARERIEELIALADIVKLSDADLAWLRPGTSPERFVRQRARSGAAVSVVTCGADGAVGAAPQTGILHVPTHPVTVVDTIGAGDSYLSTLLAGLHRRKLLGGAHRAALSALTTDGLFRLMERAACAAALACGQTGSAPPTLKELNRARALRRRQTQRRVAG